MSEPNDSLPPPPLPPPPSAAEEAPTEAAGPAYCETFDNPLGGEDDEQPTSEASAAIDPEATARICTAAADFALVGYFGPGQQLDEAERAELEHNLGRVLRKYDVPDLPYEEEIALAFTSGKIVFKRIAQRRMQAAMVAGGSPADDSALPRKEGVGQVSPVAQADLARHLSALGSFRP